MREFKCSVCSYRFDPDAQAACRSCPINQGCKMVCCPSCGFTTLDHEQSGLVRWFSRLGRRGRRRSGRVQRTTTLKEMPPGTIARVYAFLDLEKRQIEKLQAFGLYPGQWARVIQQSPVTVVDLGNTELALEADLAARVIMDHDSTQRELASS